MKYLRSGQGCPWDREQTHKSLKKYLIEETYEVLEAIDAGDDGKLCDELGDLLLQVVFHAAIGEEEGRFGITGITDGICRKMVARHTHVFSDGKAETSDDVVDIWEKVEEELMELKEVVNKIKDIDIAYSQEEIDEEFGDVLFSLVNLSRFINVQPELALTGSIEKFIRRFEYIEKMSEMEGKKLEDMTLAEMDLLWENAKGFK